MWLSDHDSVAILFIFYTYLLLPVLFKAHDLKCCLLLEINVFFFQISVFENLHSLDDVLLYHYTRAQQLLY